MTVQYLEKATTSLRAQARLAPPDFAAITEGDEVVVPVNVFDEAGAEVVHAEITTWVTPRN
jgi:putative intracellular protease/amidase